MLLYFIRLIFSKSDEWDSQEKGIHMLGTGVRPRLKSPP